MADLADIAEALAVYEVHAGFPEKRMGLAGQLVAAGVSLDDIELVGDHCRATVEGVAAAARVLASLLGDDRKLQARLVDLRTIREAQAKRALRGVDKAPGDQPYVPGPIGEEPRAVWEHDRQCELAVCRVDSDRRSIAEVAREMDVSETTLRVMLDRGRVLRAPRLGTTAGKPSMGLISAGDEAKARQDQIRSTSEFRQRMRDDGLRAATKRPANYVDFARINKAKADILETARATGKVDIAACSRDRARMGALATLEADGDILRDGPPDHRQHASFLVARSDRERAAFRDRFKAHNQGSQRRPAKEIEA